MFANFDGKEREKARQSGKGGRLGVTRSDFLPSGSYEYPSGGIRLLANAWEALTDCLSRAPILHTF